MKNPRILLHFGSPVFAESKRPFFSLLLFCGAVPQLAHGAGYSCPAYKMYTKCSAGRYMSYDGKHNATPRAGNECAACAHGYTSDEHVVYYGRPAVTAANTCEQLCTAGITSIKTSNGLNMPLYSARQTTPAINVSYNNRVCYGSLAVGAAAGALNLNVGGKIYHTTK